MRKRRLLGRTSVCIVLISAFFCSCTRNESRLQQLEDKEDIRRLITEYGHTLDSRDFAAFSSLFAEDGEWIGGFGRARGPDAIRALMDKAIGTGEAAANLHLFTNEMIDVKGDRATGITKWIFVIQGEADRPQPVFIGRYIDDFVRENGSWKFLKRAVHSDIPSDSDISSRKDQ